MNLCIVCNSRAERGPLESVIEALPEARVVGIDVYGSTPHEAMGRALRHFTETFTGIYTSRVLVLGDRYETLAAALAAMFLRIPVAHIHGGETTTGAFDDPMRHAITHIADLHFVPTNAAANRVHQLLGGRDEDYGIYEVGAPGLDGIPQNSAKRDRKRILVTFHPETRAEDYGFGACQTMLYALWSLRGYEITFTGVNADPGQVSIDKAIQDFMAVPYNVCLYREKMSHAEYISEMQHAALVIGNSSAGIIEAPWVGCPSVNIGNRQNGRPCAASVFNAPGDEEAISQAIRAALQFTGDPQPIYRGGAAEKIAEILRRTP